MRRSATRLQGVLLLAAFALQGCAYSPERQEPAPVVPTTAIAPDAAASQPGLPVDETASRVTASTIASPDAAEQPVRRAQALEAEAVQLLRDAEALASEFDSSLPPPFSVSSPPDFTLLTRAREKRSRAEQLSAELAQLRIEIAEDQRAEEERIRKLRGTTGIDIRDIESHGILGGPNSAIRSPGGGGGGGGGGGFGGLFGDIIHPGRIIENIARERAIAADVSAPMAIEQAAAEAARAIEKAAADASATIRKSAQDGARPDPRPIIYPPTGPASPPVIDPGLPALEPSTPSTSFAAESKKIDGLVKGSAAVSAPGSAKAGDPFAVYLRVSPEKLESLIKDLEGDFPENQTIKGKQGIRLTSRMTATVNGFGFEISPKEGQTQAVSAAEPTTWQWQVKAVESGVLTLNFALAGTLTIEGKEVARNFYEYQQKVRVSVSPMSFVEKYWQWLATSLAIPAIGAIWAMFRKPKDAGGTKRPSVAEKLREKRRQRASV